MIVKKNKKSFFISILVVFLCGCIPGLTAPTQTATQLPTATETATSLPTPTSTTTLTPTATTIPSSTPIPVYLTASVWTSDPQVPILVYHRFYSDSMLTTSLATKIRLSDFKAALQSLYDSGYTLVSLESWLKGDMRVAPGKKPLIITIDDLFFADQIYLESDGTPSQKSGIGILWKFSQDHPDFGFSPSIFYNMGDKQYGNVAVGDWWQVGPGWQDSLAKAIAWCIKNGALPYNHFYTHPELDKITSVKDLAYQEEENETVLNQLLAGIGEQKLSANLGNILAIPYGIWPTNQAVVKAMNSYVSTNGKGLLGVMDIDYSIRAKYLQPIYSSQFNRLDVPRITANQDAIDLLVKKKDSFPVAQDCKLGPVDISQENDQAYIEKLIVAAGANSSCPDGVYALPQGLFRLQSGSVTAIPLNLPAGY